MIVHVPLLWHTDIHSIFLQFLVTNGSVTTVSRHVILHPGFLPPLLSGWNHKWYWGFYSKIQNCCIIFDIKKLKIPVHVTHTSKQSNLNALINHALQNSSKLSHILCESLLSDFSIPYLQAFLHLRLSKARELSNTKILVHQTKCKFVQEICAEK